jgi:hypothetical protein
MTNSRSSKRGPRPNQRTRLLVHPEIQLALVRQLFWHWLFFLAGTFVVTFVLQFLLDPFQSPYEMALRCRLFGISLVLVALCTVPWFIYDSIRLSHRFVGPILRVRGALGRVSQQNNERIMLRRTDYWHDVTDAFNKMLDRLEAEEPAGASTAARHGFGQAANSNSAPNVDLDLALPAHDEAEASSS